jgi:hypothetical protein
MIELWTKEQILDKMSLLEFHRIGLMLRLEPEPVGMNVAGQDNSGAPVPWEVLEYQYIPAESFTGVFRLVGKSLIVRGHSDQDGITIEQVLNRTRMVPVVDYPTLQEYNKDPGNGQLSQW